MFAYVFLVGTWFLLHALLTKRIEPLYRCGWWGVRLGLWVAGIGVEVRGREHLQTKRRCLYVSNHVSNVDPPVLFAILPPRIAFMGKKQVFGIPVLGRAIRLVDFVSVDREDPEAARASVDEALAKLKRVSLLVYPEGTRSTNGSLQRFKHGVFLLAIRAGVPVVPLTLDGAEAIMPKGKWEIYPGTVRVTAHPPVETRGLGEDDRGRLAMRVREIVASALPPEKRGEPMGAPVGSAELL